MHPSGEDTSLIFQLYFAKHGVERSPTKRKLDAQSTVVIRAQTEYRQHSHEKNYYKSCNDVEPYYHIFRDKQMNYLFLRTSDESIVQAP